MGNITIGQTSSGLGLIVAIFSGLAVLYKGIKSAFERLFQSHFDAMEKQIAELRKDIFSIEMDSTKNFLVSCMADIGRGYDFDETTKERFYEAYDKYTSNGGNSYIHTRVETLKKENKI